MKSQIINYFLFIISAISFCQCASPTTNPVQVVNSHFRFLNSHNIDSIASQYTSDATLFSVNFDTVYIGGTGIKSAYTRYFKGTPDLHYTITHIFSNDTSVTVEYESTGTMQNLEPSVPDFMRGKKYTLKNCTVFTIKDGKIIRDASYFDQVSFLRQMGYFDQKK
jgi:steroid delta-isomerase-like uncharacterized protein